MSAIFLVWLAGTYGHVLPGIPIGCAIGSAFEAYGKRQLVRIGVPQDWLLGGTSAGGCLRGGDLKCEVAPELSCKATRTKATAEEEEKDGNERDEEAKRKRRVRIEIRLHASAASACLGG